MQVIGRLEKRNEANLYVQKYCGAPIITTYEYVIICHLENSPVKNQNTFELGNAACNNSKK